MAKAVEKNGAQLFALFALATPASVIDLLHALAACLTAGLATIAAARRVTLTEVRSTVTGDIDLNGLLGLQQRQHGCPPQAPVCLRTFLGKPAVVGSGQGPFGFRVAGIVADEEGREDDLHGYAHLVHVGEAARHVLKLS